MLTAAQSHHRKQQLNNYHEDQIIKLAKHADITVKFAQKLHDQVIHVTLSKPQLTFCRIL